MAYHYYHITITTTLLALAACHVSSAPPPPPPLLSTAAREFLEAHNQARAAVGVKPLTWSESLANAASRLARYQKNQKGCQFANTSVIEYGANQQWAKGMATPRRAVEPWVKEKEFYDYGKNTCVGNHECGCYTQVVWRNSTELGCAQASCVGQVVLTICLYNPPGNFDGERPY